MSLKGHKKSRKGLVMMAPAVMVLKAAAPAVATSYR
jgi:hypothetical protein